MAVSVALCHRWCGYLHGASICSRPLSVGGCCMGALVDVSAPGREQVMRMYSPRASAVYMQVLLLGLGRSA